MSQFKTLQFPNTAAGQAKKIRALEYETANGWRIVSETIVAGKFKSEKACCFFMIFAPCAFLAGHDPDIITITLEKPDKPIVHAPSLESTSAQSGPPLPTFDRRKWDALVQYDHDISAAAQKIDHLGPRWLDELGSAYMALADKTYLPAIVEKIQARAAEEEAEKARQASEAKAAADKARASGLNAGMRTPVVESETASSNRALLVIGLIVAAIVIVYLIAKAQEHPKPLSSAQPAPLAVATSVTAKPLPKPSFDCSKVKSEVLNLVCLTPALIDADNRLAAAYAAARARSRNPLELRADERAWIARRNNSSANVSSLLTMYNDRVAALQQFGTATKTLAPPVADPGEALPTVVGECSETTVTWVGTRLEDAAGAQVPDSGSAIRYQNGGAQFSYDHIGGVDNSKAGDRVQLCLTSVPKNCPPGDNRGKVYHALNIRTGEDWDAADSEHECGGA